jgi:hypothetical protein
MQSAYFNFILGIGRSGTTLMLSILNAHPLIQATPEVNFFEFFYNSWKNKTSFSNKDYEYIQSYVNFYKHKKNVSGFDWDLDLFKKNISQVKTVTFQNIYNSFYSSFLYDGKHKDLKFNFDKNHINMLYINEILSSMPESKFVLMLRNPMANFLSRKEKMNFRNTEVYFNAIRWQYYNVIISRFIKMFPDKFFVLRYEDLVSSPEVQLKKLANFFGFEYKNEMLSFHETVKKVSLSQITVKNNSSKKIAKNKYDELSKPIYTDRLNTWKEKLSDTEINVISEICQIANDFDYSIEKSKEKLNFYKLLIGKIKFFVERVKTKILFYLPLSIKIQILKIRT